MTDEATRDDAARRDEAWALLTGRGWTGENLNRLSDVCSDIAAALAARDAALREAQTAGEWKDIETAPKDGTKFFVYTIHGEIEISEWYSVRSFHYEEAEGGLYRKVENPAVEGWNSNQPTYWMPLPPPPAPCTEPKQ